MDTFDRGSCNCNLRSSSRETDIHRDEKGKNGIIKMERRRHEEIQRVSEITGYTQSAGLVQFP